jgi:WD40 repeat protein/serine/threonine protein kinase
MSRLSDTSPQPQKSLRTTVAINSDSNLPIGGIGPYKLIEKIGEGGFGLVFVAEQLAPVKRRVALKLIKPGMDSREVIARFEAERQALAMMDHPNIARVLDAGTTDLGHPYFVMELVHGIPITDFCDKNRLTMRDRLELFLSVCQAVQHAHQKGIIHRDIKPSNVLVTLQDGCPTVKVIDFGIAKALHQQLTDKTVYTRFAQVIGTPLYMSPEQAEMSSLDIDTRSDIYSLGVLLYELLTGTTPFEEKRLSQASLDERIRIIRQEEPPKPSSRLRQSSADPSLVASLRRIEPAQLSKTCCGDLDWITMKALDKDRRRRYESASDLAADVLRYLKDEPVLACPPSAGYLLKKFSRRYRTILATAAAIAVTLLLAAIVSTAFAFSEKAARAEADRLRREAENAKQASESEKVRAVAAEKRAIAAQREEAAARRDAQTAFELSQKNLYFSSIALAERNWTATNPKRAGEILEVCPPKLRDWEWRYLHALVHNEAIILSGDNAVYSPDGELLATTANGQDESIVIRDAASGKSVLTLQGGLPIPMLHSIVFSPDSHRLAAVCRDGFLRVWNLPSGRQMSQIPVRLAEETIPFPGEHPVGLAISPDGGRIALAGVSAEKPNKAGFKSDQLVVWDIATGKELLTITETGRSVAFSPDGKSLATTSCVLAKHDPGWVGPITAGIRILDVGTGRELVKFPPWRPTGVSAQKQRVGMDDCRITYSPDGKWLASLRGPDIVIWDAANGKELRTLSGHSKRICSLSFSADSKRLASGSEDETVRIWDPTRDAALVVYRGHLGTVECVSFRPDGKFVVSAGDDHTLRVWNASGEQGPRFIPGTTNANSSIALNPDGRSVACLQVDGDLGLQAGQLRLVLIDASTGRRSRLLDSYTFKGASPYAGLAFSLDGRLLASAIADRVQVWDVATGRTLASFAGQSDFLQHGLALSPDGAKIAFTAPQHAVEVWDLRTNKRLTIYKGHTAPVTAIAFSPHGDRIASESTDASLKLWDAGTAKEIRSLKGTRSVHAGLTFSPDGKYLLTSCAERSVQVWDVDKGTMSLAFGGHKSPVRSIAFNPAGTRMVTAAREVIRLWTWPDREEILTLSVGKDDPLVAAFLAEGTKLAAAGVYGATVWDASSTSASVVAKK